MSLSHRSWRTVSGLIGRPRSFPRGCEKLRQSLLLPLSCGSSLTDCVRLKSPIFPSFIKQNCILAATVQRAGTLTYFPPSIRFSIPTLGLFSPLCFQRRWLLQTAMSVCVRVCVHSRYKKKKKACMCVTHTWDVHTPEHQWGNPCLSVSTVLSVLLRLRSHCNSVWSWLPQCHSHIHARTVPNTNTLQLCETQLQKENPRRENWQQAKNNKNNKKKNSLELLL